MYLYICGSIKKWSHDIWKVNFFSGTGIYLDHQSQVTHHAA